MKLDQTFTVQAHPDVVWAALIDPQRVAPCLPGAAITDDSGDGMFKGEFKVKLGPTTAAYNGTMKIESLDQEGRVATMSARGSDKRGNGGAVATIVSRVSPDGDGTRVDVETDFSITGKLARFGRGGMIQDVSNRLLREFAANLQEDLGGAGPADGPSASTAASTADAPEEPAASTADAPNEVSAPTADAPAEPAASTADTPEEPAAPTADAPNEVSAPTADAPSPPASSAPAAEARAATATDGSAPLAAAAPRPPRPAAEPLDGGNLVLQVVLERLKTAFPALLVGVIAGFLAGRKST